MVTAKVIDPDSVEVEVTMRHSLKAWKAIRVALDAGLSACLHVAVGDFSDDLRRVIDRIEQQVEGDD